MKKYKVELLITGFEDSDAQSIKESLKNFLNLAKDEDIDLFGSPEFKSYSRLKVKEQRGE